jgi:antitoxin (DNA-binding transcriptional repressor) of toxin-antitoxin stability system
MKAYTHSEAQENFATLFEEAERDGAVEIRRQDGAMFRLSPAPKSKASPLDVLGVNLNVKTQDLVAAVREGRERSRRYD